MQKKYIFITGGVCSSLGKGLTSASIGLLLERQGYNVAALKLDPYLNVDPGTMNPFQHGEVYVTDDGAETDLDLGHYYRFTNSPLSKASNATSGQIYHSVIKRERKGDYLGNTVQVIPHITNEIKKRIQDCEKAVDNCDIVLVEIGGTAGDIESLPFLEAIRQWNQEHSGDCINIHLTYVPFLKAAGEMKSKPTQQSVHLLRGIGIFPDLIICRSEFPIPDELKAKISLFCNVPKDAVIEEPDVEHSIYEVPIHLQEQKLDETICRLLELKHNSIDLSDWNQIVETICNPKGEVTVGLVGKYLQHKDAYKSVIESLQHGAIAAGVRLKIRSIESDLLEKEDSPDAILSGCDGFLIPGGFGKRGWEGKIIAAKYAREKKIPYFGICYGMHVMAVEFARNKLGLNEANSTEVEEDCSEPVISLLSEQKNVEDLGGTMRLGAYPCHLSPSSHALQAYGDSLVHERHRHRYEFNNQYREAFENKGYRFTGTFKEKDLCEISELTDHPWMVSVQFHPEFQSKPTKPHPLFRDFIQAMIKEKASQQ